MFRRKTNLCLKNVSLERVELEGDGGRRRCIATSRGRCKVYHEWRAMQWKAKGGERGPDAGGEERLTIASKSDGKELSGGDYKKGARERMY